MRKIFVLGLGLVALTATACTDNTARVWRSQNREALPPDNEYHPTAAVDVDRGDASGWTFKPWRATAGR